MKFSAIIITFNEERNIERCLLSLQHVTDDIVVVDSYSTDATPEICKRFAVRFYQHEFTGYSHQKNYANNLAKYDIIFSIDADEAVSDTLAKSLKNAVEPEPGESYFISRRTNYCNRFIRFCGWYPDKKERIWNRHFAHWQGLIHEKPVFQHPVKHLSIEGDLLHYSYYTIDEHIKQSLTFSTMKANELAQQGKSSGLVAIILAPCFKFLSVYVIKLGFLDGYRGYFIAKISAYATFVKHLLLWEKRE